MRIKVKLACVQDSFRVLCPSLPGCSARGGSRERALEAIRNAVFGYLSSLDRPVPNNLSVIATVGPADISRAPMTPGTSCEPTTRDSVGR